MSNNSPCILHIETSGKLCSVALSKGGKILSCLEEYDEKYIHAEKTTVFIQQLVKDHLSSIKELSAISISIGPGSYTGLRIGLSTAKAMSFALDIPLIPINTLDIYLHLLEHVNTNKFAMLDARRMEVYAKGVRHDGIVILPSSAQIVEENSFKDFEPFMVIGDATDKLSELWKERKNIAFSEVKSVSARHQLELSLLQYESGTYQDTEKIVPLYLKEFQSN